MEYNPENLNILLYRPKYIENGIKEKIEIKTTINEKLKSKTNFIFNKKTVIIKADKDEIMSTKRTIICLMILGTLSILCNMFIKIFLIFFQQ